MNNQDPGNQFSEIDYHRDCFTLLPESSDPQQTFLLPPSAANKKPRLFCSCTKKNYAQCSHAQKLSQLYELFMQCYPDSSPTKNFESSMIWKIIEPITKFQTNSVFSSQIICENTISVFDKQNTELFTYRSVESDRQRLQSRLSIDSLSRFTRMNKAAEFVQTENERALINAGHKTHRQLTEESIWYRLAYHCYREFENSKFVISYRICTIKSTFYLIITFSDSTELQLAIPKNTIPALFQSLHKTFPESINNWIYGDESDLFFALKNHGEEITIDPLVHYREKSITIDPQLVYGSFFYIRESDKFIRFNHSSVKLLATGWQNQQTISTSEISAFLDKNEDFFSFENSDISKEAPIATNLFSSTGASGFGRIVEPPVVRSFDHIDLKAVSLDDTLCTMDIYYCKNSLKVSLSELLEARRNKQRFVFSRNGIIDLSSEEIKKALISAKGTKQGTITISKAALLQFRGSTLKTHLSGDEKLVSKLNQMLQFKPLKDFIALDNFKCTLREYQKAAVQWLLFIYDNNFGGLLCDEMGLGKTIQILAFLVAIKEQRDTKGSFLIVCPTSVISHWKKLCIQFAPSLKLLEYYSAERTSLLKEKCDVLLTSYGILRNDIEQLKNEIFTVAVFDEIHSLKNPDTAGYKAASQLTAQVKIGLTGTPIENNLGDLKTLFNLTLPGLFQNDFNAEQEVIAAIEGRSNEYTRYIQRLISPFMMRRLKSAVLSELPPKIEDSRVCPLSEQQLTLYSAAVTEKGKNLIEILKDNDKPVPYMHIFSLLTILKQICNHPALALGKPEEYESYEAGKWELFKELLEESLSSGQKVVIFTQYVGMVEIFRLYLEKNGIGHVLLTGSSRQREKIIQKFTEDDACRVFVGSLKAGGVGIDLVAGSVLIHYDRWWNAAREDQATDRVHRIGQKRVVQIFKLITEKTIEERIADIIDKKRTLSNAVLIEDSPDTLKNFSREELLGLLS